VGLPSTYQQHTTSAATSNDDSIEEERINLMLTCFRTSVLIYLNNLNTFASSLLCMVDSGFTLVERRVFEDLIKETSHLVFVVVSRLIAVFLLFFEIHKTRT
jgi:hypothetical protein